MAFGTATLILSVLLTEATLARAQNEILLVVAGFTDSGNDTTDVETLDLSGNQYECEKPADYPFPTEGGTIALNAQNRPVVCGGREYEVVAHDDCYEYMPAQNSWRKTAYRMTEPRIWSASVQLSDGRIWILGGFNGESTLSSTEVWNPQDGTFVAGPEMQSPQLLHCAARISDTQIFVAGGTDGSSDGLTDVAFIFDFQDNTWESLPAMPTPRSGHSCVATEKEVHVIGNVKEDDSRILILNLDSRIWRQGQVLDIALSAVLPLEGDRFLLVGGFAHAPGGPVELATIYEYNANNDGDLVLRPEKLVLPRDTELAILVDKDVMGCTKVSDDSGNMTPVSLMVALFIAIALIM